jgi:repressor LexA
MADEAFARHHAENPATPGRRPLTERQAEVLDYIKAFRRKNGYSPSVREIAKELGMSSTNGVTCHTKMLVKKGYLKSAGVTSRSLVPIP